MQRTERIKLEDLSNIVNTVYSIGETIVFESYSDMEMEIKKFGSIDDLMDNIHRSRLEGKVFFDLALYYFESKGEYKINRINLDPKYCEGKTFRYKIDGWGIIHFQIEFRKSTSEIECCFTVNSEKRAKNWESTFPEIRSVKSWDWKVVESKARKLILELKKLRIK